MDWIDGLKLLDDNSIDCCITSPPYWGLRDYGTATWEGGDSECDHALPNDAPNSGKMTDGQKTSHVGRFANKPCVKCGAVRIDNQLGLEKTPEEYVAKMVLGFSEVKRVLKPEGTLWLNLGDSYASVHTGGHKSKKATVGNNKIGIQEIKQCKASPESYGLKQKDLVGVPWLVAFALRSDGWYLRQDIIWHKPNPMPESVKDRCTKAHEYIFLMSKSSKYYYDNEAIKEPAKETSLSRQQRGVSDSHKNINGAPGQTPHGMSQARENDKTREIKTMRNKRSVWTVTTKPFKEAHFATFPEDLILPCVLAGCPKGGVILDPFTGAGTTELVAVKNDRNYIGFELNKEYIEIANKRIEPEKSQLKLNI